jgi:hypothetical protein
MNAQKVELALYEIDQMLDYGDAPIGLAYVRKLLAEAIAEDDPDVNPDMNVA